MRTSPPIPLATRSTVTVVSRLRAAKSATASSAATTSRSIAVRGGWGLTMSSVKKAGSSGSQP